jgi:hypothetical protein
LLVAAFNRAFADLGCVRARDAAIFLGQGEIFIPAVAGSHAPARALFDNLAKFVTRNGQKTMTADACRHTLEKKIDDLFQTRPHIIEREVGGDEAHPAVDIESNATG